MKSTLKEEDFLANFYYKKSKTFFLQLLCILNKHKTSFSQVLKSKENENLLDWIDNCSPLLQKSDFDFKLRTKIHWIIYQLKQFPKCQGCGKQMDNVDVISIENGYRKFCSPSCARPNRHANAMKHSHLNEILASLSYVDQLHYLVDNFESSYSSMISSRQYLNEYVKQQTACLSDLTYKISTKLYWIFNGIKSWDDPRVCCRVCNKPLKMKNISSIHGDYPKFCCQRCVMRDKDVTYQIKKTCIRTYGVSSPAQNYDIQKRSKKKYFFNEKIYDSAWEIAFEIYHRDAGKEVIYSPQKAFEYFDKNGCKHKYFPDFEVDGKLVEIKGGQFISLDGKFCNPYDHSLDYIMEAKWQCAVDNGVQIVSTKEILPCLKYVNEKYGKDFLLSLSQRQYDIL